jgi:hypothetical protein
MKTTFHALTRALIYLGSTWMVVNEAEEHGGWSDCCDFFERELYSVVVCPS